MSDESLLPPNATAFERALEKSTNPPLTILNGTLWNPEEVPEALLPWLAHSLSVDVWDARWTEETRRKVVASSVATHRRRGTRSAIKRALAAAGFSGAIIVEGSNPVKYNAAETHDGTDTHGTSAHWANYQIYLPRPTTAAQEAVIRRLLILTAPARCQLGGVASGVEPGGETPQATIRLYDGAIDRDGAENYGSP